MSSIKKKGRRKEIIYPILQECALLSKDDFWKQFYEDLSIGKSTKGIYIINGSIQTSNKRNGFTYNITDKSPEDIITELHSLLINYTGIYSKKDVAKRKQFVDEIEEELKEYKNSKWTSIKRKNVRLMLLADFAIYLGKKHSLPWSKVIQSFETIISAFDNKTHKSKDISYKNGKVLAIDDIEFDDEQKLIINLRQDKISDDTNSAAETETKTILLQNLFEPYMITRFKMIRT